MLVGVLAVRWLLATEPEAPAEGMHITMVSSTPGTLMEADSRAKHIEARLGKGGMPSSFVRRSRWSAVTGCLGHADMFLICDLLASAFQDCEQTCLCL
jgi:hypothetical protein